MNTPVVSSTFFLTLLLMVGLFFFIRASVKERIEQVKLLASGEPEVWLEKLQQYFEARAYHIAELDAENNQVTYEGIVRPSWFLAVFLTVLATIGLFCLALILSVTSPFLQRFVWLILLIAPISGIFYWQQAGRQERVLLKVNSVDNNQQQAKSFITVRGHRDELIRLQQTLPVREIEPE